VFTIFCPLNRILSINPFDIQQKINSESIFLWKDIYWFSPSSLINECKWEQGSRLHRLEGCIKDKTKNKLKFGNLFLTFVSPTGNY
jgi:hypothetical protein